MILALSWVIGELSAQRMVAQVRSATGDEVLRAAHNMAERLSLEMAHRARDVQLLSKLDVLKEASTDLNAARMAMDRLHATLPTYGWIGLTDAQGTVIASSNNVLLGQSIAARPVFLEGRQKLWAGDVHDAVLLAREAPPLPSGELAKFVDLAAPVLADDGRFLGVLALHISWDWGWQLREDLVRPRGAPTTLQLAVLSRTGTPLLPIRSNDATLPPANMPALEDKWGYARWSDGVKAMSAVAESLPKGEFSGFGWRVAARDVESASAAALANERRIALLWSLGVGALLAALAWWRVGRMVAPLDRLARHLGSNSPPPPPGAPQARRRTEVQRISAAVTQLKLALKERDETVHALAQQAHTDSLTGLWNRTYLQMLPQRLAQAPQSSTMEFGVLCIDLDGFKPINDKFGHEAGDHVLTQVAKRLKLAARQDDMVFRMGGDEFLVLAACPVGEAAVTTRALAKRILAELQKPMVYRTLTNLRVGATLGGAIWTPGRNPDPASLTDALRHADDALYSAKRAGKGQYMQHVEAATGNATEPMEDAEALPRA